MRRLTLFLFFILACNLSRPVTPTATPLPPTPVPQPTTASGWTEIMPGLESRTYNPEGGLFNQIDVLRIDPALFSFSAVYRQPLTLDQWRAELPDAVALVNANFFGVDGSVLGLLVSDGQVYGSTYTDRGGMLAVQNGTVRVRSNIYEPYYGEPLQQAVQGFPLLVYNGETAFTQSLPDRATRRTAAGQDAQGRILLMATPLLGLTLIDLSAYLPQTDMELVTAFNLDGGGSTMMFYPGYELASIDPVPAVLAVYPK